MDRLTVVLVLASPLLRARLRASLAQAPEVHVLGEAADMAQGGDLIREHHPALVLCDLTVLGEPPMATLRRAVPDVRLVLVTAKDEPLQAPIPVPVAGWLPFTLRPRHLAARLRAILDEVTVPPPPQQPVTLSPDQRQRYHLTGPAAVPDSAGRPAAPSPDQRQRYHPTGPAAVPDSAGRPAGQRASPPAAERAPGRSRRRLSVRHARLAALLQDLQRNPRQHPRDPETGLVGAAALERTVSLLSSLPHDAAFLLLEIQDPDGALPDLRLLNGPLLRQVSSAVQSSIRTDDFLCRLGPATFALLLPGLVPATAHSPLERLRAALTPVRRSWLDRLGLSVAVSIGFWRADLSPAEVLAGCRQALQGRPAVRPAAISQTTPSPWRVALN